MRTKSTLSDIVYNKLKDDIITGELHRGSELTELRLAESYGVSRTPIREALRRLEKDNIIELTPQKGARIVEISLKDTLEINELREVLEGLAVALAARWGNTEEFKLLRSKFIENEYKLQQQEFSYIYNLGKETHELILKYSKNKKLKTIIRQIETQIDIITRLNADIDGRHYEAFSEHLLIIDAIIEKDELLAEKYMRNHIRNVSSSMMDYYNE